MLASSRARAVSILSVCDEHHVWGALLKEAEHVGEPWERACSSNCRCQVALGELLVAVGVIWVIWAA